MQKNNIIIIIIIIIIMVSQHITVTQNSEMVIIKGVSAEG